MKEELLIEIERLTECAVKLGAIMESEARRGSQPYSTAKALESVTNTIASVSQSLKAENERVYTE